MTTWLLIAICVVLSILLLWGLVAPRSHWRVLIGWSTSDPDAAEPGDGVHGIRRAICALGLAGVLVVAGIEVWQLAQSRPAAASDVPVLEQMWGSPTPHLIDRAVTPAAGAPAGLVAGKVVGAQAIKPGAAPSYLVDVPRFNYLGNAQPDGLVGVPPSRGVTGYRDASLLVASSGPLGCIPRAVVVVESESAVNVGVYWGLPGSPEQDHAASCDMDAPVQQTVLIPVPLASPVEARVVQTDTGEPVRFVVLPD